MKVSYYIKHIGKDAHKVFDVTKAPEIYTKVPLPNVPHKIQGFVACVIVRDSYYASVGFSFCSHTDEWDENKGKWLAKRRAEGCDVTEKDYKQIRRRNNKENIKEFK